MYEELVKRLRADADYMDNNGIMLYAAAPFYRDCADAIEELIAIAESYKRSMEAWADEAARAQSRLVSVTTRLPDEWKSVLTCVTRKCVPLPEPPKEATDV